jgi:hypothetical protein
MQPVDQMMGFAPAQRPLTTREYTPSIPHGQGAALGRLDDPGGPPHIQRLAGRPAQHHRQSGHGGLELSYQPLLPRLPLVGLAGDQHSGHRGVAGQPLARLRAQRPRPAAIATDRPRPAQQAVQVDGDQQLGPHPPVWGNRPPSKARRASSVNASALRWLPLRSSSALCGEGFQGGQQGLAGFGVQLPLEGDHALKGRGDPQAATAMALFGSVVLAVGVGDPPQMTQGPPQLGWVQLSGRLQQDRFGLGGGGGGQVAVPSARTAAWASEIAPAVKAWAVPESGPRNTARAVRTARLAAPVPIRSRVRSQCPSSRSASRRRTSARSARTPSARASRSRASSRSRAAARTSSSSGEPIECVFESMGATYQPQRRRQASAQKCGQLSCRQYSGEITACRATRTTPTQRLPDPPSPVPARSPDLTCT